MKLSNIVKKITSISLATALVLSGINYQPAKAEASELPVVTVLGATLSLDADAGKQSMRVAIQVENADNASACGMSITYNGKKLDFSTEDAKYNKLYDYDADTKKVVYAVKIANIPVANFAENFTIEGYATPIIGVEEGEKVKTEAPVEKSVDGVFEAIKAKDSTISMSKVTGILMKKVIGLDIADSTEIYAKDSQNKISCWRNDSDADAAYEYIAGDDCFKITTDSSTGKGLGYQCSGGGAGTYIYSMDIKTADTVNTKVVGYFGSYGGTANAEWAGTGEWMSVEQNISLGDYGAAYLSTNSGAKEIYVKRFEIYKPITSDSIGDVKLDKGFVTLSADNIAKNDPINSIVYTDGKANVTLSYAYGGFGVAYYFKTDKSTVNLDDYNIVLNITSECEKDYGIYYCSLKDIANDTSYWQNGSTETNRKYWPPVTKGTKNYTFSDWTGNAEAIFIKFMPFTELVVDENGDPVLDEEGKQKTKVVEENATFTINSIQLVKK